MKRLLLITVVLFSQGLFSWAKKEPSRTPAPGKFIKNETSYFTIQQIEASSISFELTYSSYPHADGVAGKALNTKTDFWEFQSDGISSDCHVTLQPIAENSWQVGLKDCGGWLEDGIYRPFDPRSSKSKKGTRSAAGKN